MGSYRGDRDTEQTIASIETGLMNEEVPKECELNMQCGDNIARRPPMSLKKDAPYPSCCGFFCQVLQKPGMLRLPALNG